MVGLKKISYLIKNSPLLFSPPIIISIDIHDQYKHAHGHDWNSIDNISINNVDDISYTPYVKTIELFFCIEIITKKDQ